MALQVFGHHHIISLQYFNSTSFTPYTVVKTRNIFFFFFFPEPVMTAICDVWFLLLQLNEYIVHA